MGCHTQGSMQCSRIWTKACGSVELGEETREQRQPAKSNSSQKRKGCCNLPSSIGTMKIYALRTSTHATVTIHIRNSDQQASKHNPALTRLPSTRKKSSTSPISKDRSSPIYMKKIETRLLPELLKQVQNLNVIYITTPKLLKIIAIVHINQTLKITMMLRLWCTLTLIK